MDGFAFNARFQIATIFFLAIVVLMYIKMEKLPILSTKIFNIFIALGVTNLVFDLMTVYTITNMDTIPESINRLFHQLFIGSVDALMATFYFYISVLCGEQKRYSLRGWIVRLIPLIIGIVGVIFMPIEYYVGKEGVYSYGAMPVTIYIMVVIYMAMIMAAVEKNKAMFSRERLFSIRAAVSIWIIAAVIQFFIPYLLISGLSIGLMIFFLYLSFENPKELMDTDTGAFNKVAFHHVLSEYAESGTNFCILDVVVLDTTALYNFMGQEEGAKMFRALAVDLKKIVGERQVYQSRGNVFSIIFKKEASTQKYLKRIEEYLQTPRTNRMNYQVEYAAYLLEFPTVAHSVDEIYDISNYLLKYEVEHGPVNQITTVDEHIIERQRRYMNLQSMLRKAVDHNGFEVFYQPIFDVKAKKFSSAEALVRLKDRTTIGFVSPEEFIPMAEKNGLIMQIGESVFRMVCECATNATLPERGIHYIEVNLSGIQAVCPQLVTQLQEIMSEYQIKPQFINLEITETASVEYMDRLTENMTILKNMGCSFSMDDFGTGYSNLSQMAEIRYDMIKLDKSLIWPCFDEGARAKKSRIVLEEIVTLIHRLKIKIVAEGVETAEQVEYLEKLGVEYLQGYYFSKPIPSGEYLRFLREHKKEQDDNAE